MSVLLKTIGPLLILIILTSKLGTAFYGQYVVALSLVAIFVLIGDLGLSLEVPKLIAKHREDRKLISVFSSVYIFTKFIVSTILTIILIVFLDFSPFLKLIIGACLALRILEPEPILHGLENFRYIVKVNLISKVLHVLLIFLVDFTQNPIEKLFSIYLIILLVSNILYYFYIVVFLKIGLCFLDYKKIANIIRPSLEFYFARFFTSFYLQGSTYVLSFFLNIDLIAIYSIALDFYKLGHTVIGGIGRVLFTTLSKTLDFKLLKVVTIFCIFVQIILVPPVFFYGGIILDQLFAFDIKLLFNLTLLFYISFIFSIVNSFWGYPLFSALNKDRVGHICLIFTALAYYSVLAFLIWIGNLHIINAVLCIIFADFIGSVLRILYAIKVRIIP